MSAIVGVTGFDNQSTQELALIGRAMMDALVVHGVDDSSEWTSSGIFLGCHNQWITPQSEKEKIPFTDLRRGLTITADVLIDNREELCERLGVPSDRQSTIGDAELILLAYEKWEEGCPKYILGDYAFLIWDHRKQLLFGARDICGNRTLYYNIQSSGCYFSTIIEPLFQVPGMNRNLNMDWLAQYLAIRGMHECADPDLTPYENVLLLPPGHSITVRRDGGVAISQYGSFITGETFRLRSDEEYEEAFREVLDQAVSDRLRTIQKVAATLSGGLDSGTVVSFAARRLKEQGKNLHTYSFVPVDEFEDWTPSHLTGNERPYIEQVVQYVGNIVPNYLDFRDQAPFSHLDDLLDMIEGPFKYFGSLYWINGIYEAASRDGANILLTGGRGNFTISWGPALDYYAMLLRRFRFIKLYEELKHYSARMNIGRKRLLSVIRSKAFPGKGVDTESNIPLMIHPELARKTGLVERRLDDEFDLLSNSSFADRKFKFANLAFSNKSGIVATKLSLRHKIWERDPTFDPRVIRFCLSVPTEQYIRRGMDRALLRRATEGYLPDVVRLNQTVRGVQGADWVYRLQSEWSNIVSECTKMCNDSLASEILDVESVRDALQEFRDIPKPDAAFHPKMHFLMRCLVVYRFLQKFPV